MKRFLAILLLCAAITGCTSAPSPQAAPLPTLIPTALPEAYNITNAERVAFEFLDAWTRSDFETMYSLINTSTQEATPFETFQQIYQNAHDEMTLQSLTYVPVGSGRDSNIKLATFNYDITFTTHLLGAFSDTGREMLLSFDDLAQGWRVAWTVGDIFREMNNGGRLHRETTQVLRGSIYDRDNVVLADMENPVVVVYLVKRSIPNYETCFSTLTQALFDVSPEVIQARLDAAAQDWRTEVGTVDAQTFIEWEARLTSDCDATFDSRKSRKYYNGNLMPHVVGTVGYLTEGEIDQALANGFARDSILGRSGIERSQDAILRGVPGARLTIISPTGGISREVASNPPKAAQDVWLTIDSDLQRVVEDLLASAYTSTNDFDGNSKGASVIVMNVQTGEILALVSWPTYDLNAFAPFPAIGKRAAAEQIEQIQENPRNPLLNRATQGRYPSGSVMKIATSMAAVDSGVFSVDSRFTCIGVWTREDVTKTDWLPDGHGVVTPASAVTGSCNPFFYETGYRMDLIDPNLLPTYLRQMGMGVPTGLTDIEEDSGYIGNAETLRAKYGVQWSFSDASLMAIGQGEVEITPLQIVRLVAAIANGGTLYKPQIVQRAGILNQTTYTMQPEAMDTLDVSQESLDMVIEGMCDVTTAFSGTATFVFEGSPLLELGVCGKTGTAQDLPRITTHAWFAAYAPREEPEIAVVVMVENAGIGAAGEGSVVSAPIVRSILEYYFLGIEPYTLPT